MLNNNKKVAHFRVTVNIFRVPLPSQKATFQIEILELGSNNNLAQSLHPTVCKFLLADETYSRVSFKGKRNDHSWASLTENLGFEKH